MEQVKVAYRRLIAEHHPDKGGHSASFIPIRAAYETLMGKRKNCSRC